LPILVPHPPGNALCSLCPSEYPPFIPVLTFSFNHVGPQRQAGGSESSGSPLESGRAGSLRT
jgi:hypothetical protein